MKTKTLILVLVILVLNLSVNADITTDCYQTIICDDVFPYRYSDWGSRYDTGNPIIYCPSALQSSFNIEEVFTIGVGKIIDCNDVTSSSTFYRGYIYNYEYGNDGEIYFTTPRTPIELYDVYLNCSGGGRRYISRDGIIHDLNSDFSNPISVEYVTWYNNSCPIDSYSVSPSGNVATLTGSNDILVFEPLPKDVSSVREESFAAISTLIMNDYFWYNQSGTRANQQYYINEVCPDPTFEETLCDFDLTDDLLSDSLIGETKTFTFNSQNFGSSYTLVSNMTGALKYHFETNKVPIHIRTSIEWVYYIQGLLGLEEKSFRGFQYTYVILGMKYNSPGNYSYLIQYPSGYKFIWSAETLYERWFYNAFDGYYYTTLVDQGWVYEVREPDDTLVYYDGDDYYILYDNNYYVCLNFDNSDPVYRTDNPLARIYINGSWSSWQDMSDNECFTTPLNVEEGVIDVGFRQIQTKSKGGTQNNYVYLDINDPSIESITYSPYPLYYNDLSLNINYDTSVGYTTGCAVESVTGDYVYLDEINYNYNIEHDCDIDLYFGGSPIFEPGQQISVRLFGENYYYTYNNTYSNPKYLHYPLNWSPNVPTQCYIDIPCVIIDNDELTDLGSYEDNPFGTYDIYDQILESYSIDWIGTGFDESFIYIDVSPEDRDDYTFSFESDYTYTETGTYSVELCLKTNIETEVCDTFEIEVKDNFVGGGGVSGGGSQNQNSSFGCSFTVDFDESVLGACPLEMLRFYWIDYDKDTNWEATPLYPPINYAPNPDYMNESSIITIDMSDIYDDNYCNGYELVVDETSETERVDIYLCYDISLWNQGSCDLGDVSFSSWANSLGFSVGVCSDSTVIVDYGLTPLEVMDYINRLYEICDNYQIPSNTSGYFCTKSSTEVMRCDYDCSVHDTDSDGVNDCNDICCGGDDTIDTDSDGVPDYCDPAPIDPNLPFDPENPEDPEDPDDGGEGYYNSIYSLLCQNGELDEDIGETSIDYGGICGVCDDGNLSIFIGETELGYGGACGYCLPDVSLSEDIPYLLIKPIIYPFDPELCNEGYGVMYGLISIVLIILLMLFIILFMLFILIFLAYLLFFKKSYNLIKKIKKRIETYKY